MRTAFVSALAAAILLIAVGPAAAATITVNTTDDSSVSQCTLRDAISAANADATSGACSAGSGTDTIQITPTGTTVLGSALPDITSAMSLIGPGIYDVGPDGLQVQGNGTFRIFTVNTASDVLISGMTITAGGGVTNGGGVHHDGGGTLTLDDVWVGENEASDTQSTAWAQAYGGGVYNHTGSSLVVKNSRLSGNTARATTTATNNFSIANGSAIASRGPLTIDRTNIRNNESTGTSEYNSNVTGAVWSSGAITITNTTIGTNATNATTTGGSGNALTHGGGIYLFAGSTTDTLTMENSTIAANTSTAVGTNSGLERGGGIYVYGAGGSIESSTIAGNDANYDGANVYLNAFGETLTFKNTIVADGLGGSDICQDGNGTLVSLGHNLEEDGAPASTCKFTDASDISGVDPQLGALNGSGGGPTDTMKPAFTSPVLDEGISTGESSDQRGQQRPRDLPASNDATGDGSDIGAVELQTTNRDPSSLAFGSQAVGTTSSSQTVTVTNATGGGLNLSPAAITGPNAGDFTITSDGCDGPLGMATTCEVDVAFAPQATTGDGPKTAILQVADDESVGPLTVPLSGTATGTQPPAAGAPSTTTPTTSATTPKKKCKKGFKRKKGKCVRKKTRR